MATGYAYQKRWLYDRSRGVHRTVDAAPVAARVAALLADGWALRAVADVAGCSPAIILRLKKGTQSRIRTDLAGRIMAVDADALLARQNELGFVRNVGARRRVEALLAMGWRHSDISAAMFAAQPACGTRSQVILHQVGEWVTRRSHDAVRAAYDQLSATPGPSSKTRRLAAKYGYAPPLAWDEGVIDDPAATPNLGAAVDAELDDVLVERLVDGVATLPLHDRSPELVEAVRRLATAGLTDAAIGARVGRSRDAVLKIRSRNGIPSPAVSGGATQPIDGIAARPGGSEAATSSTRRRFPAA